MWCKFEISRVACVFLRSDIHSKITDQSLLVYIAAVRQLYAWKTLRHCAWCSTDQMIADCLTKRLAWWADALHHLIQACTKGVVDFQGPYQVASHKFYGGATLDALVHQFIVCFSEMDRSAFVECAPCFHKAKL